MLDRTVLHGGDLHRAEQDLGITVADCIDLSTGISPWAYPVGDIPNAIWQTLPYDDSGVLAAAADYYRCVDAAITPVSGSQDAIRRLPRLLTSIHKKARVALPVMAYQEHRLAWQLAGHDILFYENQSELERLVNRHQVDHVVVVNPNNPSAELVKSEHYLMLIDSLPEGGYFIIDEAFMDLYSDQSMVAALDRPSVIVLRSIGKFFGLAGLRLGFVLGHGPLIEQLRHEIMPWGVSHPALWVGEKALLDYAWQTTQRDRVKQQSQRLVTLLRSYFPSYVLTTAGLFTTLVGDIVSLQNIYLTAAKAGILLRFEAINDTQAWLRIALPGDNEKKLEQFLDDFF